MTHSLSCRARAGVPLPLPPQGGRGPGLRMASAVRTLTFVVACAAVAPALAFDFPIAAKLAPACVARVDKAALKAMNGAQPLGQMQIYGAPAVFDPHLLRVEVNVFGARTEIYAVDLTIDDACNVIAASTRLESNDWRNW